MAAENLRTSQALTGKASSSKLNTLISVAANDVGASSWDLVLKILSMALVSLLAFSSGAWFGKKLSDNDYQRQALEGEFDREVEKSSDSLATYKSQDEDDMLTDQDVAAATDKAMEASRKAASVQTQDTGKAVAGSIAAKPATHDAQVPTANESTAAEHGAQAKPGTVKSTSAAAPVAVAMPSGKPANDPKQIAPLRDVASAPKAANSKPDLSVAYQAAARVANNAAPTNPADEKAKPESRVPSSLPKTVGASADVEFTVQVASYPTAEAANEHVEAMVKKGFPAFPVEAKLNGKTWYRVSVGSFKSFNEASKFRAQLLKQADLPSAIVQKIAR